MQNRFAPKSGKIADSQLPCKTLRQTALAKYDNPAFFNYAYNPSNILTQQHNSNCLQDKDLSSVSIQLDFCRSACGYRTIYDANGNCVTANGDTYTTGDNNQTTSDGIYSYLYDSEGNLVAKYIDEDTSGTLNTGDTDVTAYTWDYHNRLTNVSHYDEAGGASDMSVDYVYDAYNRRISRTLDTDGDGAGGSSTEHYVWDGTKVMLDLLDADGSGETYSPTPETRYLWGQAVDQLFSQEIIDDGSPADVLYPVIDNLHSVRSLIESDGDIAATYSYDIYGNITALVGSLSATRFLYTCQEYDLTTGLYYYNARWYDPATGKFISEDPIQADVNLYRYCLNNPSVDIRVRIRDGDVCWRSHGTGIPVLASCHQACGRARCDRRPRLLLVRGRILYRKTKRRSDDQE